MPCVADRIKSVARENSNKKYHSFLETEHQRNERCKEKNKSRTSQPTFAIQVLVRVVLVVLELQTKVGQRHGVLDGKVDRLNYKSPASMQEFSLDSCIQAI